MMKQEKKKRIQPMDLVRFFISYLPKYDFLISFSVGILVILGTIMIALADVGQGEALFGIVGKQILYVILGNVLSCVCNHLYSFSSYRIAQYILLPILWILLALASTTASIGGSSAWLRFGAFSLQPSEFAKPLAILTVANSVYGARKKVSRQKNWFTMYWVPLLSFILCNILLILQNDFGTLFIIDFIFFVCVLTPEYQILKTFKKVVLTLFVFGLSVGIGFCVLSYYGYNVFEGTSLEHFSVRVHNTINPYDDIYEKGYQPANALYGMGDAQIIGKGLGNSTRKYGYLTQADTDYILALIIEELGIAGFLLVVLCYVIILWRLFYYALRSSDPCIRTILVGNIGYIFIHFFLNVGGVSCLIPFTGVPLLFVSRGGSALVSILISIGISQKMITLVRKKEKIEF
ncbi:MAG: FtsW/RodA/SpoVE family cell cycle protein [Firmicutes bacterium]|nr:FtsW/RodA/SpoVE family cell cycle protein [Bacillota bacterium]